MIYEVVLPRNEAGTSSPTHIGIVGMTVPMPTPNIMMDTDISQLKGAWEIRINPADHRVRASITIE